MPYCRIAYTSGNDFSTLVYNGYSLMENWWDATRFDAKEDALKVIMNNIDTQRIQKNKLKIMNIKIKGDIIYE